MPAFFFISRFSTSGPLRPLDQPMSGPLRPDHPNVGSSGLSCEALLAEEDHDGVYGFGTCWDPGPDSIDLEDELDIDPDTFGTVVENSSSSVETTRPPLRKAKSGVKHVAAKRFTVNEQAGPASLLDALMWPISIISGILAESQMAFDQLVWWFDFGLWTKSVYTGYAGFEIIMFALQWALREHFVQQLRFGTKVVDACDISPSVRRVLQGYDESSELAPAHLYGDILDRLPIDQRGRLRDVKVCQPGNCSTVWRTSMRGVVT